MASTETELYIKIGQIIIIAIILTYFLVRRYKHKIIGFNWFIVIFVCAFIQASIEIFMYPILQTIDTRWSDLQELHIIPYAVGVFVLFMYCQLILYEKPKTWLLILNSVLFGAYLGSYFLSLGFALQPDVLPQYRIYRVIFNIFQAIVLAIAFYMFMKDIRAVTYKRLRTITIAISFAVGIAFIASVLKIFEQWSGIKFYGAIPYGIMFAIMAIAFLTNPFYVYLLPIKINKIVVLKDSGTLLYSVKVGKENICEIEDVLFSGTITALKQILTETTGSSSELKKVSFRDKKMIVAEEKNSGVVTLIICDSESYMLQTATKQFNDAFCNQFRTVLDTFDGSLSIFDEATTLVKRIFPFLPPEELYETLDKTN